MWRESGFGRRKYAKRRRRILTQWTLSSFRQTRKNRRRDIFFHSTWSNGFKFVHPSQPYDFSKHFTVADMWASSPVTREGKNFLHPSRHRKDKITLMYMNRKRSGLGDSLLRSSKTAAERLSVERWHGLNVDGGWVTTRIVLWHFCFCIWFVYFFLGRFVSNGLFFCFFTLLFSYFFIFT